MGCHTVRLVVMLTFSLLMLPLAAAQPRATVPRIGILNSGTLAESHHLLAAFRHGLREHGWIEGQTLLLEERWAEVQPERLPDLVAELIRLNVDLLFTPGSPATRAAQGATCTIPIVALMGDPVGAGFVASLARPGGNITGVSAMTEMSQKFLELLKEAVPAASRVAVLWNPADASNRAIWRETQGAATALGVTLHSLEAHSAAELIEFIPLSFWYDAPLTSQYSYRRHHPWLVYGSLTCSPARWSSWISPA